MINERNNSLIKDIEKLEDSQFYIYILKNELGKVKVGITKDINDRLQNLSGSNGQGIQITRCYCSSPTYLKCLERIMHEKMKKYRIPSTEWFYYDGDSTGDRLFNNAVKVLNKLMCSKEYETANNLRRRNENHA